MFYVALSTWIPKDRFCFSLAMDIEPNQPGRLEDLMLSSSVMIWILDFPFGRCFIRPQNYLWILPLDPDLDLNWINRFSTFFLHLLWTVFAPGLFLCFLFDYTAFDLHLFLDLWTFRYTPWTTSMTDCSLFVWTSDYGYPEQDSIMLLDGM